MELAIIRAIQSIGSPALDLLFQAITQLGEPPVILLLFGVIYWAKDKRQGKQTAFSLLLCLMLNLFIKGLVQAQRPIGQPGIRSLRISTASGSSFPSSHAQTSAAFYWPFSRTSPEWLKPILWAIPFLVALSRLYLGVHYPRDVIAGLILGYLVPVVVRSVSERFPRSWRGMLYAVYALLLLPLLLLGRVSTDLLRLAGCAIGFLAADAFERAAVRFPTPAAGIRCWTRPAGGIAVLLPCAVALKYLFPQDGFFTVLRYALLVFLGLGLYPIVFFQKKGKQTSSAP